MSEMTRKPGAYLMKGVLAYRGDAVFIAYWRGPDIEVTTSSFYKNGYWTFWDVEFRQMDDAELQRYAEPEILGPIEEIIAAKSSLDAVRERVKELEEVGAVMYATLAGTGIFTPSALEHWRIALSGQKGESE